ncbi:N5,N10-methylene tetrahydromethanopterin reductase [Streptomyces spiroverticillatus]|uniref:N5,N10-methylene tetrahydromethanopterin reductase n=1 Tax=Streptomyces finlayi TaxID=67296 RepID=A0A919CAS5_9ACTN|nr:LLM class flavin-dependent oxidoreductase [Streptomyces finlayi]GHA13646.1 N5,N10-methylene tetrahydromethanopterin reductase [Streptomyces spiroverticillatus]GHC97830.1 N5,N10-methylene tetrahydromethanopterin reductase [Streptomyces finlayi]
MLPVQLGANVDPTWADPLRPILNAKRIEEAGLDIITVQDHPYQPAFYDTWTLANWILAYTEKLVVLPAVANLPLRPPAVLGKSAASAYLLSGGRLQLGLGAGAFWDAIEAYGGERRTPGEALGALSDAVDVIRAVWSRERSVRTDGTHYAVKGAHPGPPAADDGLGIWLGVTGPRALKLLGAKADGWVVSNMYFPPSELARGNALIAEGAEKAGRDPAELDGLRKLYNVAGLVSETESADPFHGTARQWADTLVSLYRDSGMNAFVFWPEDDRDRQTDLFAKEVAPLVREALGRP